MAQPVEPALPDEPPMPEVIERPAGEPGPRNWTDWLRYQDRRRERAELAGLYYQGERNGYREAYTDTVTQLNECTNFAREHSR